jgi:hypothetical protein
MVTCVTCGGTYDPIGRDGLTYFHACAPLSVVELQAAVAGGRVRLPMGETADDAVQRRTYERAEKRDENRASTAAADTDRVKAIGRGTTPVDVAVDVAPVIVVPDAL